VAWQLSEHYWMSETEILSDGQLECTGERMEFGSPCFGHLSWYLVSICNIKWDRNFGF